MMNSTDTQHEILVKLHNIMARYSGYPLELELLITLASIHPSLVRTSNCANKFSVQKSCWNLRRSSLILKKVPR